MRTHGILYIRSDCCPTVWSQYATSQAAVSYSAHHATVASGESAQLVGFRGYGYESTVDDGVLHPLLSAHIYTPPAHGVELYRRKIDWKSNMIPRGSIDTILVVIIMKNALSIAVVNA